MKSLAQIIAWIGGVGCYFGWLPAIIVSCHLNWQILWIILAVAAVEIAGLLLLGVGSALQDWLATPKLA